MGFQVSLLPAAEEEIQTPAEDPLMWPQDAEGVRYHVLRRFPYTLHYEVAGPEVTVLALAHQRRRPGYWQQR
jgi:hypothetical protein